MNEENKIVGIYIRVSIDDKKEEKIINPLFGFFEYGNKIYVQTALNCTPTQILIYEIPIPFTEIIILINK